MRNHFTLLPPLATPDRVELVLRLPDGRPWCLTLSRGMERFIGYYPRIDGIDAGGPLLRFAAADAA